MENLNILNLLKHAFFPGDSTSGVQNVLARQNVIFDDATKKMINFE